MDNAHSFIEYLLFAQDTPEPGSPEYEPLLKTLPEQERYALLAAQQVKQITDEMPGGFFIYRAGGTQEILYVNLGVLRMFECGSMEEFRALTGNSFRGMVHPDDLPAVEDSIQTQIVHSQYDLDYVEFRIVQKGGAIRWVEDYGHFIHNQVLGDVFYVFLADATERRNRLTEERSALLREQKQSEQSLKNCIDAYQQELEELYQEQTQRLEMIEGLSIEYESIFHADLNDNTVLSYRMSSQSRYQFTTKEICPFAGFAEDYCNRWVHPEDRSLFLEALQPEMLRKTLTTQTVLHVHYRILEEGHPEYLLLCIVNVGKTPEITQVVIGCRSVDGEVRREMEQNLILEDALARTKAANAVKDTFLSNMSHDIRTPMNAILGFAALAKKHRENQDKLQSDLDMIEAAGGRLLGLLNDVLEFCRLEAGNIHVTEEACSLLDLAAELEASVRRQAEAQRLVFSLDVSGLTHRQVYADQEKLMQVLLRLTENGVKYTQAGGWLRVIFTEQNASHGYASYHFIVEDTGMGINKSFLSHVFEPFERQQNTTMSGIQGAGIGLAITRSIVELMGGTIAVSSTPGQGSRFVVNLTLRLQDEVCSAEPVQPCPAQGPQESSHVPLRILLVEDNEINQEIETELLEDAGFLVDTADDGSIAVDKIQSAPAGTYALILMDIQMPVMDGYGATRAIRSLKNPELSKIPIVALSANAFAEDKKRSLESGMNAHLAKPIDIPRLLTLIEDILRHRGRFKLNPRA